MKRNVAAAVVTIVAASVMGVGVMLLGRQSGVPGPESAPRKTDSVWYHASDVALLAKTGRPQLVEFFHPN